MDKGLQYLSLVFCSFLLILIALIVLSVSQKGPSVDWIINEFLIQCPDCTVIKVKTRDDVDNLEYFIYYQLPNEKQEKMVIWTFMDEGLLSLQFLRSDESYRNELP